jgi:hypothetical protein
VRPRTSTRTGSRVAGEPLLMAFLLPRPLARAVQPSKRTVVLPGEVPDGSVRREGGRDPGHTPGGRLGRFPAVETCRTVVVPVVPTTG